MITLEATIGRATVSYASASDLKPLAARIDGEPDITFAGWHLVRVEVGGVADVHTLGFRAGIVYITSPVREYHARRGLIRTRSGHIYRLPLRLRGDDADVEPSLARHLRYALVTWGFATREEAAPW